MDASGDGGYERLVALEQCYQPADPIALYRMQLCCRKHGVEENLGNLGNSIVCLVRLAYPSVGGGIVDDLTRDFYFN